MDRVAGMLAEWFSLHERLISQSVSKNISLQLEEELQCEVWDSLEAERGALLSSEWSDIATTYKETRSTLPKADVHKILLLLILGFYGVVVLIRKTIKVYAAR